MVLQAKSSIITLLLLCVLSVACSGGKSSFDTVTVDVKAIPTIHSEGVSTLISDSGITRYRINAKIWNIYSDNVEEPYWYFPEGVYMEKFDSLFHVEGSILADTAYYYEKKKLWRLINNIKIKNLQGDKFVTSELFWDENSKTIYSDKFVQVERKDRIFSGIGFRSNQELTSWRFFNTKANIEVNESDSTKVNPQMNSSTPPQSP